MWTHVLKSFWAWSKLHQWVRTHVVSTKAMCCIFLPLLVSMGNQMTNHPTDSTISSPNKAFFSRFTSDIRFWQTCLIDHLSNLSWRWVVCHTAGLCALKLCSASLNGKPVRSRQSGVFYAAYNSRLLLSLIHLCSAEPESKAVHNYKTTGNGIWYWQEAAEC